MEETSRNIRSIFGAGLRRFWAKHNIEHRGYAEYQRDRRMGRLQPKRAEPEQDKERKVKFLEDLRHSLQAREAAGKASGPVSSENAGRLHHGSGDTAPSPGSSRTEPSKTGPRPSTSKTETRSPSRRKRAASPPSPERNVPKKPAIARKPRR